MQSHVIDNYTFNWYNDQAELVVEDLDPNDEAFPLIQAFFTVTLKDSYKGGSLERDGYVFRFIEGIDFDAAMDQLVSLLDLIEVVPNIPDMAQILFLSLSPETQKEIVNASQGSASAHVRTPGKAERSDVQQEQPDGHESKDGKDSAPQDSVI